jgi:hypothetical protein
MFSCPYCQATNCFIEWNNWLCCRFCALVSPFEWDDPKLPFASVEHIKLAIYELIKKPELSDEETAAIINKAKFWDDSPELEPFPDWRIYANYYNLLIKLTYGNSDTKGVPTAALGTDQPSS